MNSLDRAYDYCLKLLSRREYTAREISEKLAAKGYSLDVSKETLDELSSAGYLNDERYSDMFIRTRMAVNFEGPVRILTGLKGKGIDGSLAEKAVGGIDKTEIEAVLNKAFDRHIRINGEPSTYRELAKLRNYLARKGFSMDMIMNATRKYKSMVSG